MVNKSSWWYPFHYHILPPVFIVFFVGVIQYLAIIGQGQEFTLELALENSLGDATSWKWTLIFCIWAIIWLRVPSKIVHGPETPFATRPCYRGNGVLYYWVTLVTFFLLQAFYSNTSTLIYTYFPKILGVFNILALVLCFWLLIKGKRKPEHPEDPVDRGPIIYEFYRGVELHPRLLGCDVKQLTNCRIGMMGWQLFLCAFYMAGVEKHGFNTASLVHLLTQSVYIAKFFWWEVGYFFTLDMMMDRAGFYLCWGCMVVLPAIFTFAAAYSIVIPPTVSPIISILIGFFGLACILLNYRVDYEKQVFRQSANYECLIWGKPAKYVLAEYKDSTGKTKKSPLLTSGFWGLGRHMNYTFELGASMAFCACLGFDWGLWNFMYFFFIAVILFHRLIRDEEKCKNKYGQYWERYCSEVPYKMIPGIW